VSAGEGSVNITVTATAGCLWQASSNAPWLSVSAGGVTSGSGTVTIQAGPNLQTVSRTGLVTIAGLTYTVIQDAAAAAGTNPVTASPVRPIAADYSNALDRMILVSTNPDLLTILNPVTGTGQTVSLTMPPTSLSISPDGLRAAVGHDGRISYVNLTSAAVEKTFPVTTTVYSLALGAKDIFAFPLRDQWEEVRVVNIASGAESLWNMIYAGSTAGKISPNGKYLYMNSLKRYDITQALPSAFDAISSYGPRQWFSQDGNRLFNGTGQAFRLSDVASQDLQYNGTLESVGLTAVADSSAQQVTAVVPTGAAADTSIKFFGQQYLAPIGSISIPKFTFGGKSYDAHGRYLFWNAGGNRLFALVQADQASGALNDYAIYTVSLNGVCSTSIEPSSISVTPLTWSHSVKVTANEGCAWKASSNASWITVSANAFSAGSATVTYIVDANPSTSPRTGTITMDDKTLTVVQGAGTQAQPSAINNLPFRVADAEYSDALDRIVAISGNPNRLNIYDPATAKNTAVSLPLAGNAVSIAPNGLRAAVCHDGLVTIVNLQTATIEKSLSVSVNCYDIVLAPNNYAYMSVMGGWGTSSSVNISTGTETKVDLLYNGTNFRLNTAGDALYTSNTGTSGQSVTRYTLASGPMKLDYQSEVYPAKPAGYKVWFTRDGRMFGDTGSVFRTGSTLATDFIYTGTLSGFGSMGAIGTAAHSTARRLFASIGPNSGYLANATSDTSLFLHGDKFFALASKVTLPKITVGGVSANSHGKFVFWDSTGAKAYVIAQADSSAGFLNDYAIYTLSPEFTPGCAVTLGIDSGTAIAYPDTGGVAVNAAADCAWEVKSNASWIQIDTGTLGVGTGNVSYSVLANGGAARTGTITIGAQTYTLTQAASLTGPPQANSPSNPAAGSGGTQTFTFTVSAPKGAASLNIINVLINTALDGRRACYVAYIQPTNTLALVADDTGLLVGQMVLNGGTGTISNSQCTISAAGSSALVSGNSIILALNITFRPAFSGNKLIYQAGREADDTTSGWQAVGTWNVPSATVLTGPTVTSITPAAASPNVRTDVIYSVTVNDTNGWENLGVVNVLINSALDGDYACYLAFVPSNGQVYLVNDAGNKLVSGSAALSGTASIENTQCKITPTGSIAAGGSLNLTFKANFGVSFTGNRIIYVAARGIGDVLNSGWQAVGTVQPK
jgi:hypothetical protein